MSLPLQEKCRNKDGHLPCKRLIVGQLSVILALVSFQKAPAFFIPLTRQHQHHSILALHRSRSKYDHPSVILRESSRFNVFPTSRKGNSYLSSSTEDENPIPEEESSASSGIDISSNPQLYSITLPRTPGIEWGTDLSFSFVYVRNLEPTGAASLSDRISIGDQICQLRPVLPKNNNDLGEPQNLVGASFDVVMNAFATLDKTIKEVELVFFRGTKEELIAAATGKEINDDDDNDKKEEIIITVIQNKGTPDETASEIKATKGCNIREVLIDEGINVYRSVTRWTNCKGKQLCGTCIVNIPEGGLNTNRKSMDEASTLRENPEEYRLSCVAFAYGDVTVETFPPIEAAQWTR